MDYQKHYNNLMNSRMLMKMNRHSERKNGIYYEGHHIIPISKGGKGVSSRGLNNTNIVYLTAREHFLAHWLLWRIYRDRSSALAFHKMMSINKNQVRVVNSRGYEEARLAFRETNKGNKYGLGKTYVVSEEHKKKQSELMKNRYLGEKNPFFGKSHNELSRLKISEAAKKRFETSKSSNNKGNRVVLKDGKILAEFETTEEIAHFINTSVSCVKNVLGGSQKTTRGYEIKYKKDLQSII